MRMLCPAKAEAFSEKNDLFGALLSCISAPTLFVRPDIRKPAVPSWTDGHYVKAVKLPLFAKGNADVLSKFCGTAENSIRNLAIAANGVQAFAGRCSPRKEVTVCTLYGLIDLAGAIFGNR